MSEERKKKLSMPMQKKMDQDTTIVIHRRRWVDELMTREAQDLDICKSDRVKTIMIERE